MIFFSPSLPCLLYLWRHDLVSHLPGCSQDLLSPCHGSTDIFLPYLSSRCWEASCSSVAARAPKRLMHSGREKQPAVGLLMLKTSFLPFIRLCFPLFPPLASPQRKKAKAIKSAQLAKHLLGVFGYSWERLNSWATMWGCFLVRGATGT